MNISIGVCAHNEEANISRLLESLLAQKTKEARVAEIIVVSDGSTDRTEEIARGFEARGPVKLVSWRERRGKWQAINKFLEVASFEVLALSSADIIIPENTVEALCMPFASEDRVGIVAARSIPKNSPDRFLGYVAHLEAELRHHLSLKTPKFSELIAFRNIVPYIPATFVDEEEIAALIRDKGYDFRYVPEAVFYNKGPQTLGEFLSQRERNHLGHILLSREYSYEAATLRGTRILKCLLNGLPAVYRKRGLWTGMAAALDVFIRARARMDIFFRRGPFDYKWKMARTTKVLDD